MSKIPINDDNKIKHLRIMALFNSIRYFYEKNIEEYLDNKYKIIDDKLGYITITRSTHPIETLQQFLSNCNIYYFNIKKHLGYTEEPKIVHITNDIKNKYEYFKSIIEYYHFNPNPNPNPNYPDHASQIDQSNHINHVEPIVNIKPKIQSNDIYKIFFVKPDLQNDIYYLYQLNTNR